MNRKKIDSELVRFVWSRKIEYDLLLLIEVTQINPFSFKKQKPAWKDIAEALKNSELKMRVTERSVRERVGELLKKHRKEEGVIMRSTGATDDNLTELKKLLIVVNEMSLTKPSEADASVYKKVNKRKGESIRNAALNEVLDSDSDNYISNSRKKSCSRSDIEEIPINRGLFGDEMTLEEERLMDLEAIAYADSLQSPQNDQLWQDIPSTSNDNQHSVPLASVQIDDDDDDDEPTENERNNSISGPLASSATMNNNQSSSGSLILGPLTSSGSINNNYQSSSGSLISGPLTSSGSMNNNTSSSLMSTLTLDRYTPPTSNNRFSNPKKDLINYLNYKSKNELDLRKEEINIRRIETQNKQDELDILRLKTQSEAAEKQNEAENKKEELRILRLKTEAEIEERKKTQDLLIALLTKKN